MRSRTPISRSDPETADSPQASLQPEPGTRRLRLAGPWRATALADAAREAARWQPEPGEWTLDLSAVTALDTAGAALIHQLRQRVVEQGGTPVIVGTDDLRRQLLELVGEAPPSPAPPRRPLRPVSRLGEQALTHGRAGTALLAFLGAIALAALPAFRHPRLLQPAAMSGEMVRAGIGALPITGLLAFLVGIVVAYQGGAVLEPYGATTFMVELVGNVQLRELGPILVAVIVAGRTGSAYAAELGTMRVTGEIDALRTMGVDPLQALVLPRLLALMVVLPLITLWADAAGLAGGILIANLLFGMEPVIFLARMPEAIWESSLWLGLAKAPVFALLVAVVGCHHGLQVRGSAAEVGRATTMAVVQAIFLVIVTDALFSVVFEQLDL
ncbi:ABC transporter permease [Thiohalospira sp.]|uniref:ABC transporter permease n=1 Tax=Thiohalospira sp. TaxID=3080549 RepID=UPI00397F91A5